jgi:hypothetical protein
MLFSILSACGNAEASVEPMCIGKRFSRVGQRRAKRALRFAGNELTVPGN